MATAIAYSFPTNQKTILKLVYVTCDTYSTHNDYNRGCWFSRGNNEIGSQKLCKMYLDY